MVDPNDEQWSFPAVRNAVSRCITVSRPFGVSKPADGSPIHRCFVYGGVVYSLVGVVISKGHGKAPTPVQ